MDYLFETYHVQPVAVISLLEASPLQENFYEIV